MDRTQRNSLILGIVLLVEAVILKLAKKTNLWFFIALPIILAFVLIEFVLDKPKEKKRNLK